MHNRSVRQNKFNLPSMRNLWNILGGYDALVEYNECAIRQLLKKWEQNKETTPEWNDFIKRQAAEVGLNLGSIDVDRYRQDIYLWYLVHPYGCIDSFIKEFKDDLKAFGFDISLDFNNKSAIEKLIEGLRESGISVSVEQYKLDLDRYYRRCRNLLAHKLGDDQRKEIARLYGGLDKEKIFAFYPSLNSALPAPCKLTFDDYTLCTANLKNITDSLTTDVYNSIDWNKFRFEECRLAGKLTLYKQKPQRIATALTNYCRSKYGITLTEKELSILKNKLAQ